MQYMNGNPDETDRDEMAAFVGRGCAWYGYKWDISAQRRVRYSWNWVACLFGPAWMVYRKMYGTAALTWLAIWALCMIRLPTEHVSATLQNTLGVLPGMALMVATGLFGNELYRWSVSRRIMRLKQRAAPDTVTEAQLQARGGTALIAASLLWIATSICAYMQSVAHHWPVWH
jgi:hypothetical protein